DQTVVEGSEVSLEGEASDSDGSIVSYEWLQLSSDDIVTINNSDKAKASFDAPDVEEEVEITFQLTVTDDDGAQGIDSTIIKIQPTPPTNTPPYVNAGDDQTVVEGSEVSLEGEASDSDGSIVSYEWLQLSSDDIVTINNS
ncbi:chitinase, partial [Pseudoalteromonas sp. SR41-8]|uniref:PKD domain-containing protein n=1 Tax=Pseudoalteromonas sp. SR41-8 TaxID=2760946 RepID=UPI001814B9CC